MNTAAMAPEAVPQPAAFRGNPHPSSQSPRKMGGSHNPQGYPQGPGMIRRPQPLQVQPGPYPSMGSVPLSPRWDSLQNSSDMHMQGPSSPTFPYYDHPPEQHHRLPPHEHRHPPPVTHRGAPPPPRQHPGLPRSRQDSPSSRGPPLQTKMSLPDMRAREGVANFSRPRTSSINHNSDPPYPASPGHLPSPPGSHIQYQSQLPPTPPWHRSRHPSTSSTHSTATHTSLGGPPSIADSYGPELRNSRVRRGPLPPPTTYGRPPFGASVRVDSNNSARSAPGVGGSGPWLGGDELRSSFRSQRTISTTPGTAATERSSSFTRSSATSFEPPVDEPSIDDLMDMYEGGFDQDSPEIPDESFNQPPMPANTTMVAQHQASPIETPSATANRPSEQVPTLAPEEPVMAPSSPGNSARKSRIRASRYAHLSLNFNEEEASLPANLMDRNRRRSVLIPAEDSDNDSLKPPPRRTDIDAEIRRSKLIFASPDFRASIPHLLSSQDHNDDDEDENKPQKRDSGKSIVADTGLRKKEGKHHQAEVTEIPASRPTTSDSTRSFRASPNLSQGSSPALNKSGPPPIVDDDPGSRDRYGFKKETQYVTRKEYDSWNKRYTEYLDRRKKKWVAYLKENSFMTDRPNRFPALSPKTRRFVRKGIPPEWRGAAWFYYAGGPAILSKHAGLYEQLLYKRAKRVDVEAIERDLHRTFPDNIQFKPPGTADPGSGTGSDNVSVRSDDSEGVTGTDDEPAMISALRRVLWAFSIYNPHIGYCQSLNFIAGMLLLFVETEEQTFWLLNVITRIYLPGTHEMSLEGSKVDLSVLMTELRSSMPHIWDKIGGELDTGDALPARPQTSRSLRRPTRSRRNMPSVSSERLPPITLSMTAWFMSCFIGTLPVETTLRVWDVFFCEGSKTLFNTALAIFKLGESEVKAVKDPMEMFGVVQSMPRRMIDANALMEASFKKKNGIANLSQGTIEARRQERRAKALTERQQHMSTPTGRVAAAGQGDDGVRRKGTLFGKKRSSSKSRARKA